MVSSQAMKQHSTSAGIPAPENPDTNPAVTRQAAVSQAEGGVRHTQIKICGFTNAEDAQFACSSGVDAIGLVFYPPSSRNIEVHKAADVVASLPPFVTITGLFLNAERSLIEKVLERVPLGLLQFHGTESPEFCQSFNRPYIKSVAMKSERDVVAYTRQFESARGFLLDSNSAGSAGGSGESFDWSVIPSELPAPLILAGGLDCYNVAEAVTQTRPVAVDVSSSVESAKGIKDQALMQQFIQSVRAVDSAHNSKAMGAQ